MPVDHERRDRFTAAALSGMSGIASVPSTTGPQLQTLAERAGVLGMLTHQAACEHPLWHYNSHEHHACDECALLQRHDADPGEQCFCGFMVKEEKPDADGA